MPPIFAANAVSSRLLRFFDAELGQLPRAYWFLWGGTLVNRMGSFVLPMLTIYLTGRRGQTLADAGLIVSGFGLGSLGGVTSKCVGRPRCQPNSAR